MTRAKLGALVAVLLAGLLLGAMVTGRETAPSVHRAGMNVEAAGRAVAFFEAHTLGQDPAAAWDMTTPGTLAEYGSRADYIRRRRELVEPRQAGGIEVQEFRRGDDYLYLVSNSRRQVLVWVTQTPDGWLVRRFENYHGEGIPW